MNISILFFLLFFLFFNISKIDLITRNELTNYYIKQLSTTNLTYL